MKFQGVLKYVRHVADVIEQLKYMHTLSTDIKMGGTYTSDLTMLADLKNYGENLVAYSYLNPKTFLYRSVERNSLLVEIKGYELTISYIGTRSWFINFLKKVGLLESFDNIRIDVYDSEQENYFLTKPHQHIDDTFVDLPLEEQRDVIQQLVHKATVAGETGDLIRYGSYKTNDDEQGFGWFVVNSDYLKGEENSIIKRYFNSKENNIRINTLKEFITLYKSVNRVLRHI